MHEIRSYLDSELNQRSQSWKALKNKLVPALPPEFLGKIVYAVIDDQTLTIFCDSPAWTSKLRFYEADIAKTLRTQGIVLKLSLIHISEPTRPY